MARKPRTEFVGAVYHVINHGNRGKAIYQDDEDRLLFLRFLRLDLGKESEIGKWKMQLEKIAYIHRLIPFRPCRAKKGNSYQLKAMPRAI